MHGLARSAPAAKRPRSRLLLRLIATERALRGVFLIGAAIYPLSHLASDFGRLADHLMRRIELDPRRPFLHRLVERLHHLRARAAVQIAWAEHAADRFGQGLVK